MIMRSRNKTSVKPARRRPRKRHVQLDLRIKFDKNGQLRGGKRANAGRHPKGLRAGSPHKARPEIDSDQPQHVTLRVVGDVGSLRRPHMFRAIRAGLEVMRKRVDDCRIVHFSVQGNHIHLLCEADNRMALARGVQGFQISAAKHLNQEISKERGTRRRGQVFADRYHVRAITSVRETRNVLCYVMNNWRHHGYRGPTLFNGKLDAYSSGLFFPGWAEQFRRYVPEGYEPPAVAAPRTWYLEKGWKIVKAISVYEVPGSA